MHRPGRIAITSPGHDPLTYAALDQRSRAIAELSVDAGVPAGGTIAILMENRPEFLATAWGTQRAGFYYTPVNWHLTVDEAGYIVANSSSTVIFTSELLAPLARRIMARCPSVRAVHVVMFPVGQPSAAPTSRPYDLIEMEGEPMYYSSGTSGRPKGIRRSLTHAPYGAGRPVDRLLATRFGFDEDTVYLSPGSPLYHAAPLAWSMSANRLGGRVVLLSKFDPVQVLEVIEAEQVTHVQFVPTMLVRLLKLPASTRRRYDLSSLRMIVHSAGPCAPDVKEAVVEWLGPRVVEYYASSENIGFTMITTQEWLEHRGSVGKPGNGEAHVLDDEGNELSPGQVGTLWFSGATDFSYFDDAAKTDKTKDARGWRSIGDLGHLDADGYLYIDDRRSDLIISGGVNIYPREVEEALILCPKVVDVAVIGVSNPEMGMEVKAIIQPTAGTDADAELTLELLSWCQQRLAKFKIPRTFDFVTELPRLPSGKIRKGDLVRRYDSHPSTGAQGSEATPHSRPTD